MINKTQRLAFQGKSWQLLFAALILYGSSFAQGFPGTDSLRNYNTKYITNNPNTAFTNLRLHTLIRGLIDWVDTARAGTGGGGAIGVDTLFAVNDSTIRYRKSGVWRNVIIKGVADFRRKVDTLFKVNDTTIGYKVNGSIRTFTYRGQPITESINDSTFRIGSDTLVIRGIQATASNGITKVGNDFRLGSPLLGDTEIPILNYGLSLTDATTTTQIVFKGNSLRIQGNTGSISPATVTVEDIAAGGSGYIKSEGTDFLLGVDGTDQVRIENTGDITLFSYNGSRNDGTTSKALYIDPATDKLRYGTITQSGWSLTGNASTNPSTNYFGTSDNQPVVIKTNGTERGRFLANGKLFWGPSNTSVLAPDVKVESSTGSLGVMSTATASTTGGGILSLGQYEANPTTGNRFGSIQFLSSYTGNSSIATSIDSYNSGGGDINSNVNGGYLSFSTRLAGGLPRKESVRISNYGYLGVRVGGAVDPWTAIHARVGDAGGDNTIASTGAIDGTGSGNFFAGRYGSSISSWVDPTGAAVLGQYGFGVGGNYVASIIGGAATAFTSTSRPSYLAFNTTAPGSTTMTEAMRINQLGNVGVGTNNPQSKLHVITPDDDSGFVISSTNPNFSQYLIRATGTYSQALFNTSDNSIGNAGFSFANSSLDVNSVFGFTYSPSGKMVNFQTAPGETGWRFSMRKNSSNYYYQVFNETGHHHFGPMGVLADNVDDENAVKIWGGPLWAEDSVKATKLLVTPRTVLSPLASAPSSPTNGTSYYNSTDNIFYDYTNGSWVARTSGGVTSFTDGNGFDGTISGSSLSLTTQLTSGSVPFIGASGALSQDNTTFFWDNTNKRLGIGTASPSALLHLTGSSNASLYAVNTMTLGANSGAGANLYATGVPSAASQRLGFFLFGSNTTGTTLRNSALIGAFSSGAWTDGSSYPTDIVVENTAAGSTSRTERLRIASDGLIKFGGTTSSFPALQRSGTGLIVRLADNSGDASLTTSSITVSGLTGTGTRLATLSSTGVAGAIVNGSNGQVMTMVSGSPAWSATPYELALSDTSTTTVSNTTSTTTLLGTGLGSATVNNITAGSVITIKGAGYISTDATAGIPTLSFTVANSSQAIGLSGLANSLIDSPFSFEVRFIIPTIGNGKRLLVSCLISVANNGSPKTYQFNNVETILNISTSALCNVQVSWDAASASNSLTSLFNTIEINRK